MRAVTAFMGKTLAVGIMIAAIALVYFPSLHGAFVFDDDTYIVHNPAIRDLSNFAGIGYTASQSLTSRYVALYSFAVNYHFSRLDPFGYHLTNLLIHILTVFLVFWFFLLLISSPRLKTSLFSREKFWLPGAAALIFAFHPVQTQAVSYISQRCVSLATFFYLLSLCCYCYGRIASMKLFMRGFCYLMAGVAALAGMFTKEIVVTLPLMIIFIEKIFLSVQTGIPSQKEEQMGRWLKPLIFVCMLVGMVVIVLSVFRFRIKPMFFEQQTSQSHEGDIITLGPYLLSEVRVAIVYLRLFFSPVNQNFDYDFPLFKSLMAPQVILSILFWLGLMVGGWRVRKTHPLIMFGIGWFFVTFLPDLVPRGNLIFEHKLYLLSVGLVIAAAAGIFEICRGRRAVFLLIIIFWASLLAGATYHRNNIWKDPFSLWSDVVKKSPNKSRAWNSLGLAYYEKKDVTKALECFSRAVENNALNIEALNNRGVLRRQLGQTDLALQDFSTVLQYRANSLDALNNRGIIYKDRGQTDLALTDFQAAAKLNPTYSEIYFNMALVYESQGRLNEAVAEYTRAIETNPRNAELWNNRGIVYQRLQQYPLALDDFLMAIKLNPELAQANNNLGSIMFLKGDYRQAIAYYTKAIELHLAYADCRRNRAVTYQMIGEYAKAIEDYSVLIQANPSTGQFYYERSTVYDKMGARAKAEADRAAAKRLGYSAPSGSQR